jgi:hypothetical protein
MTGELREQPETFVSYMLNLPKTIPSGLGLRLKNMSTDNHSFVSSKQQVALTWVIISL